MGADVNFEMYGLSISVYSIPFNYNFEKQNFICYITCANNILFVDKISVHTYVVYTNDHVKHFRLVFILLKASHKANKH